MTASTPTLESLLAREWDALIIGAGHNGLTAAAYLAREGLRVLVLEGRDQVGGACTLEEPKPGFKVSPCAYLCGLLHPLVIEELEMETYGFRWTPASEGLFVPLSNGDAIQLFEDTEACLKEVKRIAPDDVEGFRRMSELLAFCRQRLRPPGENDVWVGPAPTREEIEERVERRPEAIALLFEWSMGDFVDHFLSNELLKEALFGQGVIGTCATPFDPGTAFVHFHHSSGTMLDMPGTWGFVEGGMGRVSFILADIARRHGAVVATGVQVSAIEPGLGVRVGSGYAFRAPVILSNATPGVTRRLLGHHADPAWTARVDRIPTASATMKVNLFLDALPDFIARPGSPAAHHQGQINLPLTRAEWPDAFARTRRGELPEKLWIEIYCQSAVDSSTTPRDQHAISLFCQPVPSSSSSAFDWDRDRAKAEALAITTLARHCSNIPGAIIGAEVMGPPHIEKKLGLTGGHIFHGEILPPYMWEHRLSARTPMPGLYLCGAGTHPGGSVIGVNGRNAAMAVLEDLGRNS